MKENTFRFTSTLYCDIWRIFLYKLSLLLAKYSVCWAADLYQVWWQQSTSPSPLPLGGPSPNPFSQIPFSSSLSPASNGLKPKFRLKYYKTAGQLALRIWLLLPHTYITCMMSTVWYNMVLIWEYGCDLDWQQMCINRTGEWSCASNDVLLWHTCAPGLRAHWSSWWGRCAAAALWWKPTYCIQWQTPAWWWDLVTF